MSLRPARLAARVLAASFALVLAAGLGLSLALPGCASGPASDDEATTVAATVAARLQLVRDAGGVLDALHAAAARADGPAYFALFHPDAVFIGTDASERWSLNAFRAYCEPYFAQGQGWTYTPTERHLMPSPSGDVAWFDERLQNEKYGEVRGSGVLVRRGDGRWLVAQYVLSFPVPNALAADLVERVRALPAEGGR